MSVKPEASPLSMEPIIGLNERGRRTVEMIHALRDTINTFPEYQTALLLTYGKTPPVDKIDVRFKHGNTWYGITYRTSREKESASERVVANISKDTPTALTLPDVSITLEVRQKEGVFTTAQAKCVYPHTDPFKVVSAENTERAFRYIGLEHQKL